ncbi:hypothetical protein [Ottowia beijingensis]|uniref:hypothetical protein n=1 Tax=Ottowia beijingensis TaxID=1207057 RepID=UPI002FDB7ABA
MTGWLGRGCGEEGRAAPGRGDYRLERKQLEKPLNAEIAKAAQKTQKHHLPFIQEEGHHRLRKRAQVFHQLVLRLLRGLGVLCVQ